MKGRKLLGIISILIALATILAGCEALPPSSVGTNGTGSPLTAGKLQINLTDAPAKEEVEQVWLTVAGVKIHLADNGVEQTTTATTTTSSTEEQTENNSEWLTLALAGDARFNLLELQNGLQAKLAVGDLAPGKYTQIRMDVTKVEVKIKGDDTLKEAKLPSNTLKFVHPFNIVSGQVTEIVFDFDAMKSINATGNGKYMCKPVIKLNTTKEPKAEEQEAIKIAPTSLPNGGIGIPYDSSTLTATGGVAPYTWSISAGAIPTGLVFDGVAGTLSGTPTAAGDFTFTVKAEDSTAPVKKNATKQYIVNIAAQGALQITTTNLTDGTEGTAYPSGINLKAIGGVGVYNWTLASGSSLPAGLALNASTGVISGTPTAKGNYTFTAQVTDSATPTANTDTQVITIRIIQAVVTDLTITTVSLPNGGVAVPYDSTTLAATGGTTPYAWSITAGAIPTGLTFDGGAGTLSGTPTTAGDFTFTVKAEDSTAPIKKNATKQYTVNIAAQGALQITTTNLTDGTEGTAYPSGINLKAIGGVGAYSWSLAGGSLLPTGLALNPATGGISGAPATSGNYTFTAQVTDSATPTAITDTQIVTIKVVVAP